MQAGWFASNLGLVGDLLAEHVYLAVTPVVLGLLIALPLGYLAVRWPKVYPPLLATSSVLYSIPSLAIFILLPGIIGTQILDPLNIVIALTIYSVALLVRTVVDGLGSVPEHVRIAATALGFQRWRQVVQVELPIATPVIVSGLRVATVANISMVSVGALIGVGGLGALFKDGFQRDFLTPIVVGMVLSVALALTADTILVLLQRLVTPWVRAEKAR